MSDKVQRILKGAARFTPSGHDDHVDSVNVFPRKAKRVTYPNVIRATWFILLGWALLGFIAFLIFGCSDADQCDNAGATKCEDEAVWVCTTGHELAKEQQCSTLTTFEGERVPGVCCHDIGYAYCARECVGIDAGE